MALQYPDVFFNRRWSYYRSYMPMVSETNARGRRSSTPSGNKRGSELVLCFRLQWTEAGASGPAGTVNARRPAEREVSGNGGGSATTRPPPWAACDASVRRSTTRRAPWMLAPTTTVRRGLRTFKSFSIVTPFPLFVSPHRHFIILNLCQPLGCFLSPWSKFV